MAETLRKISLYFRSPDSYWVLSPGLPVDKVYDAPTGEYPLDFLVLLSFGHYRRHDSQGLPLSRSRIVRAPTHNYTRICGWALANWSLYLRKRDDECLKKFLLAADYILRTADRLPSGAACLRGEPKLGDGHIGEASAMSQGQAMSVLCRAWIATGDQRYLDLATECLPLFKTPVEKGGVLGRLPAGSVPWLEEYPQQPINHVLNGMVFAAWGLRDLAIAAGSSEAGYLRDLAIDSLCRGLSMFDAGYWSYYSVSADGVPKIASMNYHCLHVCLLAGLLRQTNRVEFATFGDRFELYTRRVRCRGRALVALARNRLRWK